MLCLEKLLKDVKMNLIMIYSGRQYQTAEYLPFQTTCICREQRRRVGFYGV